MSLKLSNMPKVLVGLYATEFAFTTLVVALFAFFAWSRQLPSDYAKENLGRIARIMGFILNLLRRLVILFHYIVGILLLVMIG